MTTYVGSSGLVASTGTGPSVVIPAGTANGDLLVGVVGFKPYTINVSGGAFSTFGELVSNHANGTVASGSGVGSMKLYCRAGEYAGSGSLGVTLSGGPAPSVVASVSIAKSPVGTWDLEYTDADDSSTSGTSVSVTGGATLDIVAEDWLLWIVIGPDDVPFSAESITVPGCTLGAITQLIGTTTTTTSGDAFVRVYKVEVVSGTASGAPSASATTTNNVSSATSAFLRLRDVGGALAEVRTAVADLEVLATSTATDGRSASLALGTLVEMPQPEARVPVMALQVMTPAAPENTAYIGWGVRL